MRELMRIPVFNHCSATGWGVTNESRKVLTEGLTPDTRAFLKDKGGVYLNGDAHHPHMSFTDSTRSEEHTSELQSLMRISYAVFCLKQKKTTTNRTYIFTNTETNT